VVDGSAVRLADGKHGYFSLGASLGARPNVLNDFPLPAESARLWTNTKVETVEIVGPDAQIVFTGWAPLGEKVGALVC